MGVWMHYIQHHPSTLMQNMQLIRNGPSKPMISSREFDEDILICTLIMFLFSKNWF